MTVRAGVEYAMSDLAAAVGATMGSVLQRQPLSPDEDFFDCGGDSLRAVELIARLVRQRATDAASVERLRTALLLAVFDDATPVSLAAVLDTNGIQSPG